MPRPPILAWGKLSKRHSRPGKSTGRSNTGIFPEKFFKNFRHKNFPEKNQLEKTSDCLPLKKRCYSCGWMITFKLPSWCRAGKRKPSTVSCKGKTWVIISVTLILLCWIHFRAAERLWKSAAGDRRPSIHTQDSFIPTFNRVLLNA